jgi:hypothetical protein
MAKVTITLSLREEIYKKFKQGALEIFTYMRALESNPTKGKELGNVAGIVIKELRYENFRFYFITDGHVLKFGTDDELSQLLIKFVRMSEKKDQQKTINKIRDILKSMGFEAL